MTSQKTEIPVVGKWRRYAPALIIVMVVGAIVAFVTAERWSFASAQGVAQQTAASRAVAGSSLLASELQKVRLLPLVLSDYPDVQIALTAPTPDVIRKLNARLELLATRTDAAAIYVVGKDGVTIASSNWRLPTSFVGKNYGFRPYFYESERTGAAEQFALGTVSKRPGLYLARRTVTGGGVVVVKVEFDKIEDGWSHQSGPTLVRDENGVVVMANHARWRLRTTRPLTPDVQARVKSTLQYGENSPRPLAPELVLTDEDPVAKHNENRRYASTTLPVPVKGWTLTTLEPIDPALAAATAQMRVGAMAVVLVAVVVVGLFLRAREKRELSAAAQRELEAQVLERTAELRGANERLLHESRERERNEARLNTAREELAQSNRLATLGQITAGVAHEINQPLTAIRTFAENATTLLDRKKPAEAAPNLSQIIALTERIGDITGELRMFVRRDRSPGPARLNDAIDGAMLLVGDRLRGSGITVERSGDSLDGLMVAADRVRTEQILINLLQNAADAVADVPQPRIDIAVKAKARHVEIRISDNGPGVGAAFRAKLFSPFFTRKADGLGLGLVISRDLAREVGGDLTYVPGPGGAEFLVKLVRA